ncbi:MAG: aldehyde dehydrogenase family protein, partial [Rhodospirillales bacterium]|nr:aldehyde dehydrogenase family protein [Rhodospirillales bacterium]
NSFTIRDLAAPFGGRGQSGVGREGGEWSFDFFCDVKDVLTPKQPFQARVLRPERVGSLAGQTTLAALPRVLLACAVYVGNDSGPKHIAGAIGVPTVGIHSGVVDATEWAPIGERSVAIRRNMSCSPCYFANAADCPRNLACLTQLEPALVHRTVQTLLARPIRAVLPDAMQRNGASARMKGDLDVTERTVKPAKSGRAGKAGQRSVAAGKARTGRRAAVPA